MELCYVGQGRRLGVPLQKTVAKRGAGKQRQEPAEWKLDHKRVCASFDITWPCVCTDSQVSFAGMLPREREATIILDELWVATAELEFVDINTNLQRLLQGSLREVVSHDSDGEDLVHKKLGRSPWRSSPPTLVGSGKVPEVHAAREELLEHGHVKTLIYY